ncbi:MAG: hypothetical protein V4642_09890 [Bacteroidota bacterium]
MKSIVSVFVLCVLGIIDIYAQAKSDPLTPARMVYPQQIGVIGGVGLISQSGDFNVTCECPAFEGGRGTGFLVGMVYEDDLFKGFVWGATLTYQKRPIEALYRQTDSVTVTSQASGKSFRTNIEFRSSASASFSYLTLMPFVKYVQLNPLFLRAGVGLTSVISGNVIHRKELLTTSVLSPEGTVERVNTVDENGNITDNIVTIEDGEFPEVNAFQISLEPAIGVDIRLGKSKWYIAPVVQYSFPITTISEKGADFKLNALQIMGEIRYAF